MFIIRFINSLADISMLSPASITTHRTHTIRQLPKVISTVLHFLPIKPNRAWPAPVIFSKHRYLDSARVSERRFNRMNDSTTCLETREFTTIRSFKQDTEKTIIFKEHN